MRIRNELIVMAWHCRDAPALRFTATFLGQIKSVIVKSPAQIDTDERVIRPDQFIKEHHQAEGKCHLWDL